MVEAAVARGAVLVDAVHDWEYGERQAAIDDPFEHQWMLNQTLIDVAPEQWGGQAVTPPSGRSITPLIGHWTVIRARLYAAAQSHSRSRERATPALLAGGPGAAGTALVLR